MLFLLHALRPENIFIDVGANVGAYTIFSDSSATSRIGAEE